MHGQDVSRLSSTDVSSVGHGNQPGTSADTPESLMENFDRFSTFAKPHQGSKPPFRVGREQLACAREQMLCFPTFPPLKTASHQVSGHTYRTSYTVLDFFTSSLLFATIRHLEMRDHFVNWQKNYPLAIEEKPILDTTNPKAFPHQVTTTDAPDFS